MAGEAGESSDPRGEIVQSLREEYESNLEGVVYESLADLTRVITGRIVDRFKIRRGEFRDRILEGARLMGVDDTNGEFGALVDSVLEDFMSDLIGTVSEAVEGYVRWSKDSRLMIGIREIVEELIDRLADEMFRRIRAEGKRRTKSVEDYLRESPRWRVLRAIEEGGPMTTTQIIAAVGIGESSVRNHLRKLMDGGYVKRKTDRKPYVYIFVKAPWLEESS